MGLVQAQPESGHDWAENLSGLWKTGYLCARACAAKRSLARWAGHFDCRRPRLAHLEKDMEHAADKREARIARRAAAFRGQAHARLMADPDINPRSRTTPQIPHDRWLPCARRRASLFSLSAIPANPNSWCGNRDHPRVRVFATAGVC